jgi:RNA polymerase sigma-70 factor (ECF subfamily)
VGHTRDPDQLALLLKRARAGDTDAFGEVVARFQTPVVRWAYARLGNWHDAEDAAQESFITAYRKLGNLRDLNRFPSWLRRIVLTACSRRTRTRRGPTESFEEGDVEVLQIHAPGGDPIEHVEQVELRAAILASLRSLTAANRSCIRLHYLEGYSVKEVAARLGVPGGTVKRRLHDARIQLRQTVPQYAPERRGQMIRRLEGLTWHPTWTSHVGCMKGCLNYLGANTSLSWVFGATGHAFILNIHEAVCASGPTALNAEMFFRLAPNAGCRISGVCAERSDPDFSAKQEAAWCYVRRCLDSNTPCYGWELDLPEFYTIHGYDDVGYYFSGPLCDEGAGPKPWREVGASEIGCLEMYGVHRSSPARPERTLREACAFALDHADNPRKWVFPHYSSGRRAFEAWADALEQGTASRFGNAYNAEVWAECRREAVSFLREARDELSGQAPTLLEEAIHDYDVVATKLKAVRDLHPFQGPGESRDERIKSPEATTLLRQAGGAEAKGLEDLRRVMKAL